MAWENIEAGTYVCKVKSIRNGQTKAGKYRYTICYRVIDGDKKGRLIFENVNPTSEKSVAFAKDRISQVSGGYEHDFSEPMTDAEVKVVEGLALAAGKSFEVEVSYTEDGFSRTHVSTHE